VGGASVKVEAMAGVDPSDFSYVLEVLGNRVEDGTTDDEGNYRVSGLRPGKYRVRVNVKVASSMRISQSVARPNEYGQSTRGGLGMHLSFYPPGTLRQSKATVFEIKGDEQVSEADVKVDLTGFHSIRGKATVNEKHSPFVNGLVGVEDEDDKDFRRIANVEPDGSFVIAYVPEGTYTLVISGASFLTKDELRNFRSKVRVVVMDHDVDVDEILLKEFGGNAKP